MIIYDAEEMQKEYKAIEKRFTEDIPILEAKLREAEEKLQIATGALEKVMANLTYISPHILELEDEQLFSRTIKYPEEIIRDALTRIRGEKGERS